MTDYAAISKAIADLLPLSGHCLCVQLTHVSTLFLVRARFLTSQDRVKTASQHHFPGVSMAVDALPCLDSTCIAMFRRMTIRYLRVDETIVASINSAAHPLRRWRARSRRAVYSTSLTIPNDTSKSNPKTGTSSNASNKDCLASRKAFPERYLDCGTFRRERCLRTLKFATARTDRSYFHRVMPTMIPFALPILASIMSRDTDCGMLTSGTRPVPSSFSLVSQPSHIVP